MNNEKPTTSQLALRRLLIVIGIVVGVIIYSYGVSETQVDLEKPQQPDRQAQVQRALRELLSPRIFSQDAVTADQTADANFAMGCPADSSPVQQPEQVSGQPYLTISPECGKSGDPLTIDGYNYPANSLVNLFWVFPAANVPSKQLAALGTPSGATDLTVNVGADGHFSVQVQVPKPGVGGLDKIHQITVQSIVFSGTRLSDTTNDVLAKMVETVFLALVATTVAIPFSILVSFLAAHNLMRPIKIMSGSLLVGFILLPLGWWLGTALLAPVGAAAVNLAKGQYFGLAATLPLGFMFSAVVGTRSLNLGETNGSARQIRSIAMNILAIIVFVVALGLIAGIMLLIGRLSGDGLLGVVIAFFHTIGRLIELLIPLIAGIAGGFTLLSIGMRVAINPMRTLVGVTNHAVGGVLGIISGGLLLYGLASFGSQAALLGLLTPVMAGILGAAFLPMLYKRVTSQIALKSGEAGRFAQSSVNNIMQIAGAVIAFIITFTVLDVETAIIRGSLPTIGGIFDPHLMTAALIGAVLGGGIGLLSGARASFPVGDVVYNVTRTILNLLRSIEPLIMGLVFVSWVGIGPFAGLLALTLHSVASLGKLYSEQIESIDAGPIEALQATGANRLQTIVYAVIPQVVPPYISFTMYRWDINVRMSTIIGFVGGGGIGFLLQQQINLLRYRDAGVAVLAIAVVVSILDYASASLRERLV